MFNFHCMAKLRKLNAHVINFRVFNFRCLSKWRKIFNSENFLIYGTTFCITVYPLISPFSVSTIVQPKCREGLVQSTISTYRELLNARSNLEEQQHCWSCTTRNFQNLLVFCLGIDCSNTGFCKSHGCKAKSGSYLCKNLGWRRGGISSTVT